MKAQQIKMNKELFERWQRCSAQSFKVFGGIIQNDMTINETQVLEWLMTIVENKFKFERNLNQLIMDTINYVNHNRRSIHD